jgi:hypothetical protein
MYMIEKSRRVATAYNQEPRTKNQEQPRSGSLLQLATRTLNSNWPHSGYQRTKNSCEAATFNFNWPLCGLLKLAQAAP